MATKPSAATTARTPSSRRALTDQLSAVAPLAPVDVAVVVRGVTYSLNQVRTEIEDEVDAYTSVLARDGRMLPDSRSPRGGYVVGALECVHMPRCRVIVKTWDRAARRKQHGPCDCGAQAAMNRLLATGRG